MEKCLRQALELRAMGFAIHWLRPGSKVPVLAGWSDAPVLSIPELESSYQSGFNVGFRAGKWSVVDGKEICVLDIDVRGGVGYAQEAYEAAASLSPGFEPTVISGSKVGRHQFVGFEMGMSPDCAAMTLRQSDIWLLDGKRCDRCTRGAKPAWMVELLSTGKNVVLPPSIHPETGHPYEWYTEN